MSRAKLILSFLLILSLLFSCAKVVDEDVEWQLESLPVVFSVISPNHIVQVSVSKTVIENEKPDSIYYPEARVFIREEDENWIELTRQSSENAVYNDVNNKIEVEAGKTYFLRMDLSDRTITAQTSVPLQEAAIIAAQYIVDSEPPTESPNYMGTLNAKLRLPVSNKCIMMALAYDIGVDNSTFINQENVVDRFSVSDSIDSFDLKLITFDSGLEKYRKATAISSTQAFYDGSFAVFIGAYSGLLPRYTNIVNGVGLFASYVVVSKSVTVSLP